jgi:hypothetical protein
MADGDDNIGRVSEPGEVQVGIFWMVATPNGANLLSAACDLSEAEAYGDCLTFWPGHFQVWDGWRNSRDLEAATRAIVRTHEYEDWPRGRIVFNRKKDAFILYCDRKLMRPRTLEQIQQRFRLPVERTKVEADFHYQSAETVGFLD